MGLVTGDRTRTSYDAVVAACSCWRCTRGRSLQHLAEWFGIPADVSFQFFDPPG